MAAVPHQGSQDPARTACLRRGFLEGRDTWQLRRDPQTCSAPFLTPLEKPWHTFPFTWHFKTSPPTTPWTQAGKEEARASPRAGSHRAATARAPSKGSTRGGCASTTPSTGRERGAECFKTSSIPKVTSRATPGPREHPGSFADRGSSRVCGKGAAAKPEGRSMPAARRRQRAGKRSQAAPGHPAGAARGPGTRPSGDEAAR